MRTLNVGGNQGGGDPPFARRDCPQRPNLLASRCVWIGGALSVAIWVALAWIFWGHA